MRTRFISLVALPLSALLLVAACGDGGENGSASVEDYCRLSAQLNASASRPSDDQLDALVNAAPDEVRNDVKILVESLRADVPADGLGEAGANVTRFEEEHCGGDLAAGSGGTQDGGAPALVTFLSPANGAVVSNPIVIKPNVVRAEIAPAAQSGAGQGHYHVTIDEDCVPSGRTIPSDANHVHYGDGSSALKLPHLSPGRHTLCLQLGDGQHRAFGAVSTITVVVEG